MLKRTEVITMLDEGRDRIVKPFENGENADFEKFRELRDMCVADRIRELIIHERNAEYNELQQYRRNGLKLRTSEVANLIRICNLIINAYDDVLDSFDDFAKNGENMIYKYIKDHDGIDVANLDRNNNGYKSIIPEYLHIMISVERQRSKLYAEGADILVKYRGKSNWLDAEGHDRDMLTYLRTILQVFSQIIHMLEPRNDLNGELNVLRDKHYRLFCL